MFVSIAIKILLFQFISLFTNRQTSYCIEFLFFFLFFGFIRNEKMQNDFANIQRTQDKTIQKKKTLKKKPPLKSDQQKYFPFVYFNILITIAIKCFSVCFVIELNSIYVNALQMTSYKMLLYPAKAQRTREWMKQTKKKRKKDRPKAR